MMRFTTTILTNAVRLNLLKLSLLLTLSGIILFQTGCLKKPSLPSENPANLKLLICLAEKSILEYTCKASSEDLKQLLIKLKNKDADLTIEKSVNISENSWQERYLEIFIHDLYPGTWEIDVFGLNSEHNVIFQGGEEIQIESEKTNQATIYMLAGPGTLNITFDASQIPGFGDTINSGRLYVYLDPTSGRSTSFPLIMDGNKLKGEASLKEGSVAFKVAIPNVSDALYVSPYYITDIEAGKTKYHLIRPDGSLSIITFIDSTPPTPEGLTLSLETGHGSSTEEETTETPLVVLTWNPVSVSDLAGYYIYKTDENGRFKRIAQTDKITSTYTDFISGSHFYNGKISYAVSSLDRGGNESFWSPSQHITEEDYEVLQISVE